MYLPSLEFWLLIMVMWCSRFPRIKTRLHIIYVKYWANVLYETISGYLSISYAHSTDANACDNSLLGVNIKLEIIKVNFLLQPSCLKYLVFNSPAFEKLITVIIDYCAIFRQTDPVSHALLLEDFLLSHVLEISRRHICNLWTSFWDYNMQNL